SRTIPRTIASAEPATWLPPECLRSPPPRWSIRESPAKKTHEPRKRPSPTPPSPAVVSNASWTSSKATALIRTPAPKAMIRPSDRRPIGNQYASNPPRTREEQARSPQKNDSPISVLGLPRAAGRGAYAPEADASNPDHVLARTRRH